MLIIKFKYHLILYYLCFSQTTKDLGKKQHKVTVEGLLNKIPDALLDKLSSVTNVDYQVKKLYGKNLFYLLLYGYLESTRISLRSLEDIYHTQKFKFLFNIDQQSTIKYNSLSDRLANMDPDYFRMIYEYVYDLFSSRYNDNDAESYSIVRVDSTMVAEATTKLKEGITTGNQHNKKKQVKYTVSMTNLFPSGVDVFTQKEHSNENLTIPQVIFNHKDKSGIFVFDRGVNKRDVFTALNKDDIKFIVRLDPKARYKVVSTNELEIAKHNNLKILSDSYVTLFNKQSKQTEPFRLIRTVKNDNSKEEICFLTNCNDHSIREIIEAYKKRWDIEVFFRFIKQELNFSHFLSTTENGIKSILYLTLTLSMLLLIYKKENKLGYKTAVRRFRIELDELITKMIITFAGGDPSLVFR